MSATYDTVNRIVILDQIPPVGGVINIDVQKDLYSDGKNQWVGNAALRPFIFPWQAIGGQPLPGGGVSPRIFFLISPWKIRPWEGDHQLTLSKNLFTEDGSNLTVPTLGDFTVLVNEVSDFSSGDDRVNTLIDSQVLLDSTVDTVVDLSNITFANNAAPIDDFYNDKAVVFEDANGNRIQRFIMDYTGATRQARLNQPLPVGFTLVQGNTAIVTAHYDIRATSLLEADMVRNLDATGNGWVQLLEAGTTNVLLQKTMTGFEACKSIIQRLVKS